MAGPKSCLGYRSRSEACFELRQQRLSYEEIGTRVGVSPGTVRALIASYCRRPGLQQLAPARISGSTAALEAAAMDLWDDGLSFDQIAARLEVPRQRVASILAYMREGDNDRAFGPKAIASQTAALLAAIRKHHPERCAG